MLRISVFGGLRLEANGAPISAPGLQPRRLALLALLAVAREAGLSRDKLVAYLWPELSDDRARHILRQAIYALRSTLGATALTEGTTTLILNSNLIGSDISDFTSAIDAQRWDTAAAMYAGPFLDGFFLRGARTFDEWQDAERRHLERLATIAFEHVADAASAGGNYEHALNWSQRLAALDPLNSRSALRLVKAMAAAGDIAGALRYAREHQATRREELGAGADPELERLTQRLLATEAARGLHRGTVGTPADMNILGPVAVRWTIERVIEHRAASSVFLANRVGGGPPRSLRVFSTTLTRLVDVKALVSALRSATGLNHPRLVPLLEVDALAEYVYCVSPYTLAETLRERLAERLLSIDEVVRLACALGDALAHAHAHGVLHLDIRPKHILWTRSDIQLAEIGVASAVRGALAAEGQRTGLTLGAPAYMSPEQAAGQQDIDARSDLYSLGCVLYEALIGEPPLAGPTPQALMMRRMTEAVPPLRHRRATIPLWLESAVIRLLARAPADRFASAPDLLSMLTDHSPPTPSAAFAVANASSDVSERL